MIETFCFLMGLGFSLLVYFLQIRPLHASGSRKFVYFILSLFGITGTLFLSGVLVAHFLRKLGILQAN
jgi:hypothetical protein